MEGTQQHIVDHSKILLAKSKTFKLQQHRNMPLP